MAQPNQSSIRYCCKFIEFFAKVKASVLFLYWNITKKTLLLSAFIIFLIAEREKSNSEIARNVTPSRSREKREWASERWKIYRPSGSRNDEKFSQDVLTDFLLTDCFSFEIISLEFLSIAGVMNFAAGNEPDFCSIITFQSFFSQSKDEN